MLASKKLTEKVTWVGKVDWELERFHGDELSTARGSSYNSYLIRDEKVVLIDTVWLPYDKEFVANLKDEIDLAKIDYIIVQHAEIDHSGALPELMRQIPDTPIYCTNNGKKIIQGHHHQDWNFITVKTGDTLNIGESTLTFVEAPMLHWPDTMFTYMSGENVLFSNDAFGQHYATETLYNDKADNCELYEEAIKYYANILTPFSAQVRRKIEEVLSFELPLDMICTSHGVIWRDNPAQIVEQYLKWAGNYQENQITIVYDTMWNGTKLMAEKIAEGIALADQDVVVKIYNIAKTDINDVITEIFRSKTVVVGSPTITQGIIHSIAALITMMKGLKFKNKKAAAFGCYGWSGEAVKVLNGMLADAGFEIIGEGCRNLWNPDSQAQEEIIAYGKTLA